MRKSCWMSRYEWVKQQYGENSKEYEYSLHNDEQATCMLPKGHKEPHHFTFDGNIEIHINYGKSKG